MSAEFELVHSSESSLGHPKHLSSGIHRLLGSFRRADWRGSVLGCLVVVVPAQLCFNARTEFRSGPCSLGEFRDGANTGEHIAGWQYFVPCRIHDADHAIHVVLNILVAGKL